MITFTPAALLTAWERCLPLSPVRRAVTLLELAEPSVRRRRSPRYTIGSRDGELLQLRVSAFGAEITGLVACPACAQTVEIAADANTIIASMPCAAPDSEELTFDRDGYRVSFRLPTSEDLIALGASAAQTQPERFLLARPALGGMRGLAGGGQRTAGGNRRAGIACESMNEHDPLADIELACVCPGADIRGPRRWTSWAFLWAKLGGVARPAARGHPCPRVRLRLAGRRHPGAHTDPKAGLPGADRRMSTFLRVVAARALATAPASVPQPLRSRYRRRPGSRP